MNSPALDRFRFQLVAGLLALVLLGQLHWMAPAYSGWLALLLGFATWRSRHELRAAPVWLRLPLLIATFASLIATAGSPLGREGGSAMLGGLLVLKLFETSRLRDGRVVIAAILFYCMIGFLFGQGLSLTLYLCAMAVLGFLSLHVLGLVAPVSHRDLLTSLGAGMRRVSRIAIAALPLTLVAFVFLPRLSTPLWGAPWDATQGRTGISDRMRPGALSRLWNDDTPAFRITFEGQVPPAAAQYWRGPVLWHFDGSEWTADKQPIRDQAPVFEAVTGSIIDYEILMEPTEQVWWFPLDMPLRIPADSRITRDGQVRAQRPLISPRSERFRSAWQFRLDAEASPEQRALGLQLPAQGNPRARALAATWRARFGEDEQALIDAALALFHREFIYTLEPPPLGSDIVDDFLFDTKAGYCEYFASSFVFLMRAAGIPARIVTGFQGGSYNAAGGYWIVRNSDAHAWSEVWLDGRGWVRVDPTAAVAPERIDRGSLVAALPESARWYSTGWGLEWRNRIDLIARYWRKAVIEFDDARQRRYLQRFGLQEKSWQALAIGLLGFGALALMLGVALSLRQARSLRPDPLLAAYRRFVARLARAGVARAEHEGPIQFGQRAAKALPEAAPVILELSRRFAEQRYGESAGTTDPHHREQLAKELAAFRPGR